MHYITHACTQTRPWHAPIRLACLLHRYGRRKAGESGDEEEEDEEEKKKKAAKAKARKGGKVQEERGK